MWTESGSDSLEVSFLESYIFRGIGRDTKFNVVKHWRMAQYPCFRFCKVKVWYKRIGIVSRPFKCFLLCYSSRQWGGAISLYTIIYRLTRRKQILFVNIRMRRDATINGSMMNTCKCTRDRIQCREQIVLSNMLTVGNPAERNTSHRNGNGILLVMYII